MSMQLNLEHLSHSMGKDFDVSLFSEAILLVKDENVAREDRRLLRRTGFKEVNSFASGVDAIESIIRKRTQKVSYTCFVLCYEFSLVDMEASTFLNLLRLHPQGINVPVFIILSSEKLAKNNISPVVQKEKYINQGATGVFVSPITPNKVFEHAKTAYFGMQVAEKKRKSVIIALSKADEELKTRYYAILQEKIQFFENALLPFVFQNPAHMSYEDAYTMACEKLIKKLYEQAAKYFKRAIAIDSPYKAASLFGMHQLYHEKGDTTNSKIYLMQSFQAFLDSELWEWVEECAMRFCEGFPRSPHPILGLLTTAIKRNDLTQLLHLVKISVQYLNHKEVANSIVKGCFHYELSENVLRIIQHDSNLYHEVITLLEDRKQERFTRLSEISLNTSDLQEDEKHVMHYESGLTKYFEGENSEIIFDNTLQTNPINRVKDSFDDLLTSPNDVVFNDAYLEGLAKKEFAYSNSLAQRESHMKTNSQKNVLLHLKPKKKASVAEDDEAQQQERHDAIENLSLVPEGNEKQKTPLGAGAKGFIDSLPLVVLDDRHRGSLWGDIVNIAKQTARAYKRVGKS